MTILIATDLGADWLLKSLDASTAAGSKMLDSVWSLLLQGDLYSIISKIAAPLTLLPLSLFVINSFRNRNLSKLDERFFTGDLISYILVGMIITSLYAPAKTGSLLYGMRTSTVTFSDKITTAVASIAGDPNKAMASIIAGRTQQAAGVSICNRLGDEAQRTECLQSLEEGNQRIIAASQISRGPKIDAQGNIDFGTVVQDALKLPIIRDVADAAGKLLNFDGDMIILTVVVPLLMTLGTIFIICLEVGCLCCCLMFPFTLLGGIVDRGMLIQWFKAFWSFSLINVAYKIIVSSVAFAMMTASFTDTLAYALIVGIGAPFIAVQVVSGNNLGVLSGIGSAASKLVGR